MTVLQQQQSRRHSTITAIKKKMIHKKTKRHKLRAESNHYRYTNKSWRPISSDSVVCVSKILPPALFFCSVIVLIYSWKQNKCNTKKKKNKHIPYYPDFQRLLYTYTYISDPAIWLPVIVCSFIHVYSSQL